MSSYRAGEADGLAMLTKVKVTYNVPIVTDLHTPAQAEPVAAIADVVQLPLSWYARQIWCRGGKGRGRATRLVTC